MILEEKRTPLFTVRVVTVAVTGLGLGVPKLGDLFHFLEIIEPNDLGLELVEAVSLTDGILL